MSQDENSQLAAGRLLQDGGVSHGGGMGHLPQTRHEAGVIRLATSRLANMLSGRFSGPALNSFSWTRAPMVPG